MANFRNLRLRRRVISLHSGIVYIDFSLENRLVRRQGLFDIDAYYSICRLIPIKSVYDKRILVLWSRYIERGLLLLHVHGGPPEVDLSLVGYVLRRVGVKQVRLLVLQLSVV